MDLLLNSIRRVWKDSICVHSSAGDPFDTKWVSLPPNTKEGSKSSPTPVPSVSTASTESRPSSFSDPYTTLFSNTFLFYWAADARNASHPADHPLFTERYVSEWRLLSIGFDIYLEWSARGDAACSFEASWMELVASLPLDATILTYSSPSTSDWHAVWKQMQRNHGYKDLPPTWRWIAWDRFLAQRWPVGRTIVLESPSVALAAFCEKEPEHHEVNVFETIYPRFPSRREWERSLESMILDDAVIESKLATSESIPTTKMPRRSRWMRWIACSSCLSGPSSSSSKPNIVSVIQGDPVLKPERRPPPVKLRMPIPSDVFNAGLVTKHARGYILYRMHSTLDTLFTPVPAGKRASRVVRNMHCIAILYKLVCFWSDCTHACGYVPWASFQLLLYWTLTFKQTRLEIV